MTLEEIRKILESRRLILGGEVNQLSTGTGPFLYLAVPDKTERIVLGVWLKDGKVLADICDDESGMIRVAETEIKSPADLEPLLEMLPKPWMDPVVNVRGIDRLEVSK